MNRTLGSVGGGKNILDRDIKYVIKSYVSLYYFVHKQLVRKKNRFVWLCDFFLGVVFHICGGEELN